MANSPLMGPRFEEQLWGELEQRQVARLAASATTTPASARLASDLSRTYPWLDPGTIQSLTLAGQGPATSTAQLISQIAAEAGIEDGEFEDPYSTIPDSQLGALWSSVPGKVGRGLQQGLRGALAVLAGLYEEPFERVIPAAMEAARFDLDRPGGLGESADEGFWERFQTNLSERAAPSLLALTIGEIMDPNQAPKLFGFNAQAGEGLLAAYNKRQNLRTRLTIPGVQPTAEDPWANAWTFGRGFALEFTEPGTEPYKWLSGVFDFYANLTPVDLGLGKVAKGGKLALGLASSQDIINAGGRIGLLPGVKKSIDLDAAINDFLGGRVGRQLVEWGTETTDVNQIWQRLGRNNVALADSIAKADNPEAVLDLFRTSLGSQMRVPTAGPLSTAGLSRAMGGALGTETSLFGVGAKFRHSTRNIRLTHEMPKRPINPEDLDDAANTVHDYIRNARLGDDRLNHYLGEIARIKRGEDTLSRTDEMYRLIVGEGGLYDETFKSLMDEARFATRPGSKPLTKRQAHSITRAWRENVTDGRLFFLDEAGKHADLSPAATVLAGETIDQSPVVHLLSERLNSAIPLPDINEIKRATGLLNQVWDGELGKLVRGSVSFLDHTLGTTWKAMQLVTRLAYPVRVIGEEQVRLAAVGVSSAFRHPIDYLAWVIGHDPDSTLARNLAKVPGLEARGAQLAMGEPLDHIMDFQAALSRKTRGHAGAPGWVYSGRYERVRKYGDDSMVMSERYVQGALDEIRQLHADPLAQRVAGGLKESDLASIGMDVDAAGANTMDAIKEWYWQGTGRMFREEVAKDPHWRKLVDGGGGLSAREASDAYVDTVMRRVNVKTNQNPALLDAIGTGKLDDISIMNMGKNAKARQTLETHEDSLPDWVKAETLESLGDTSRFDRITERLFSVLMAGPTNTLSRSPFFRQTYWNEMERLMGFADPQTQEAIIKSARDLGKLTRGQQQGFARIALKTSGTQLTSLADADTIAKAFALDATRKTLYDLSRRNQFFESTRLLFPFGEAWKEIFTTWTRIIGERPQILRRGQQAVEGAMGPGFGGLTSEFLGTGTQPGEGFIYEDPSVPGQLIFNYPGSVLASRFLLSQGGILERFGSMFDEQQAGFGFTAPVESLNLFTATILPGIGPTVQLPMAIFTKVFNTELPGALNDIIFPFGEPPIEEGPGTVLFETFMPSWATKVFHDAMADPDAHRLLANTTMDVARALVRNGTHSTDSQDEINRLYDDSADRARLLFWIRGFAQAAAPAGPQVRWQTKDAEGNWTFVQAMVDEYRALTEQYDGDTTAAMDEYIRKFGTDNLLALQGKSRSLKYRPLDAEGDAWLQNHSDLETRYDLTIGFFVPEPREGEFDYDAYHRSFDTGAREAITPKQAFLLHNQYVARTIYEEAKRKVAGRYDTQAETWLALVKQQLAEEYPGFEGYVGVDERPKIEHLIGQLEEAIADPRLANAPATPGIQLYFQARQRAQEIVDTHRSQLNGSKSFTSSKSTRYLRDWLRMVADEIKAEHPEFVPVWEFVFSRELNEDLEEDEAVSSG